MPEEFFVPLLESQECCSSYIDLFKSNKRYRYMFIAAFPLIITDIRKNRIEGHVYLNYIRKRAETGIVYSCSLIFLVYKIWDSQRTLTITCKNCFGKIDGSWIFNSANSKNANAQIISRVVDTRASTKQQTHRYFGGICYVFWYEILNIG